MAQTFFSFLQCAHSLEGVCLDQVAAGAFGSCQLCGLDGHRGSGVSQRRGHLSHPQLAVPLQG